METNNSGGPLPQFNSGSGYPNTPVSSPSIWQKLLNVGASILLLLIAPALALFLILFVFQTYEVDGPSMESTLQHQDRLIVLKLPQTIAQLSRKDYIPKRGDVIVFNSPELSSSKEGRQLIKRVIGIPGDRVVIIDKTVTVYNKEHPEGFLPDKIVGYTIDKDNVTQGNVNLTINDGEVFVLGDNRENSLDSRYFGIVNSDLIVGKLFLRVYPFNKIERY